MAQPVVAIVGRPNVGKSTLFNRIVQKRTAIEERVSGVTRDRLYGRGEWLDNTFILVDTGGISFDGQDPLADLVRKQAEVAIQEAAVILMVVDLKDGVTPLDEEVAAILRKSRKQVILVGNKGDNKEAAKNLYDFYALGMGEALPVSAAHGLNIGDLLDRIVAAIPKEEEREFDGLKVAIVGRPNVGKSSLVNHLAGEERVIVSEIPGTTRDAVDTRVALQGREYLLVDTAGLRQKRKVEDAVEYYSVLRSLRAMEDADVVVAVLDAVEGITDQDKKILGYADEEGKALIIAFNKWDLVEEKDAAARDFREAAREELAFVRYAPLVYISARTGKGVARLFEWIDKVHGEHHKRVGTGQLNAFLEETLFLTPPPVRKGQVLKVYYATQIKTAPPTFAFFVNDRERMHFSYLRHLENKLRETFDFTGTSIKMVVRTKKGRLEK
jgi:GTPase